MTPIGVQNCNTLIILQKNSMNFPFYKIFAKVQSNTARSTLINTKRTATFTYLKKIFFGGDRKDFFNYN